eukprot:4511654-Pyramimonas_sp.AAC.1
MSKATKLTHCPRLARGGATYRSYTQKHAYARRARDRLLRSPPAPLPPRSSRASPPAGATTPQ